MTSANGTIARPEQPNGNQVIEQYRHIFAEVLPTHIKPETWVRVAQGALRRDTRLAQAAANNPQSLVAALLDAARRGLEPGTEQYYLVAYGRDVQGIVGYQGEIELIYRASAVSSVIVEAVYENDVFEYRPGVHDRPLHEVDWFGDDRGALKGVYAYAVMKDGATSRVVVMNRKQVMEHKAMSKGTSSPDSPWNKWEQSMWLKTAAHELTKWVPTSAEYLRDQARAAGEMIRHANRPASAPPAPARPATMQAEQPSEQDSADVVEGQVVAETQPNPAGAGRTATDAQLAKLHAAARAAGMNDRDELLAYIAEQVKRDVASTKELTTREASLVIDALGRYAAQQEPQGGAA